MTLNGAIKQLHELRNAEDMPFYYKPAIAEVINVLLMDTQEVRHGRWENDGHTLACSNCHTINIRGVAWDYCPNCGAKMEGEQNG